MSGNARRTSVHRSDVSFSDIIRFTARWVGRIVLLRDMGWIDNFEEDFIKRSHRCWIFFIRGQEWRILLFLYLDRIFVDSVISRRVHCISRGAQSHVLSVLYDPPVIQQA
jgi:hypothetical protein